MNMIESLIDKDLVSYIEHNILPLYAKNERAHQLDHIMSVIERSFELSNNLDVDFNMVYTATAYHDIGHHIDAKNHEKVSAKIMYEDANLKQFFDAEKLLIIKEAIEDHRASLDRDPRSIYGQIISSADRNISADMAILRTHFYGLEHYPDYSQEQLYDRSYNHLKEKFGRNGYAKVYIVDDKYLNFLKEMDTILCDKEKFYKRVEQLVAKINE